MNMFCMHTCTHISVHVSQTSYLSLKRKMSLLRHHAGLREDSRSKVIDEERERWGWGLERYRVSTAQATGNLWSKRQRSAAEAALVNSLFLKVLLFFEGSRLNPSHYSKSFHCTHTACGMAANAVCLCLYVCLCLRKIAAMREIDQEACVVVK